MSNPRKKRKKRLRAQRLPGRSFLGSDEARFRLASRLSTALGIALLLALAVSYVVPSWRRTLGPSGNLALRVAGVALIIVSMMFGRLGKNK